MNKLFAGRATRLRQLLAVGMLLAVSALAHAQYIWVDDKGVKQLSDRPPPASVPPNRILKAPPGTPAATAVATAAEDPAPAAPAAPAEGQPKAPPTLAERAAEFRKRKISDAEKEQKAAEESRRKADMATNCEAARQNKASLESGSRIQVTDKNGERSFMDDAQRAQQLGRINRILQDCR